MNLRDLEAAIQARLASQIEGLTVLVDGDASGLMTRISQETDDGAPQVLVLPGGHETSHQNRRALARRVTVDVILTALLSSQSESSLVTERDRMTEIEAALAAADYTITGGVAKWRSSQLAPADREMLATLRRVWIVLTLTYEVIG